MEAIHTQMEGNGNLQQNPDPPVDDVLHRVLERHKINMKNRDQTASGEVCSCTSVKDNNLMDTQHSSSERETADSQESIQRTPSPVPSCVSMKSAVSQKLLVNFSSGPEHSDISESIHRTPSPVPSCVSMNSDMSQSVPVNFSSKPEHSDLSDIKNTVNTTKEKLESLFKELEDKAIFLLKNELKKFKKILCPDYPACPEKEIEDEEDESSGREGVLKITLHILRNMNQKHLADTLESKLAPACHGKLKCKLKSKYQRISEGLSFHGNSALLNEIYTELYITEGGSGEVNNEHEVRQIEFASRRVASHETPIKCNDIFKALPGQDKPIRTVMTKGVAGIGKTVSVQKFILDWAEGKVNQDVLFIFPLPFRELNLMKGKKLSLLELIHQFFPETQDLKPRQYRHFKIMFIFDGLDECRLPLFFRKNERLVNMDETSSVDVLLTNLIKGNLLPSALIWITTRPAAVYLIPPECVDQVTEVRGFSDLQKQEYFRKRISDQDLANKIIIHMKSSRSLYIMCHIPVFCWIASTVLERMLDEADSGETPKTLTQMFTHFLIFQIKHRSQKYDEYYDLDKTRQSILALGRLAFYQLEKGNLIFYEEDLTNCALDITEMSVYSGVCTQIFRRELELHLGKVFSFVHLSIQEFLAALYAFLSFTSGNRDVLEEQTGIFSIFSSSTMSDFLNNAVDKALQSDNGHLDLFLRFLLGLSLESNQSLLKDLLTQTGSPHNKEETVTYIKEKIKENPSTEKSINLFNCLNELNDHSLVQEVQTYLSRVGNQRLHRAKLSPAQWSALVFVLLNSEDELDEFDLSKYDPSEECLLRMLPVVKASRKAVLTMCSLGEKSCEKLGLILQTQAPSTLRELDLSNNNLQDAGVKLLSNGLRSSHCKLEILRLAGCKLSKESCKYLTSALQTEKTYLRELNLCNNNLQDSGVEILSEGLESPYCKLEVLRLAICNLGVKPCEKLAIVLQLIKHPLRELDLSNNDLKDSGVKILSEGLMSTNCKLEILRLSGCMVTEEGCSYLALALSSNPSHLKELDLTYNHPGDSGLKLLSAPLEDPHCKLDMLRVEHTGNIWIKPGLRKYVCELSVDLNTAHTRLCLSEGNRKVTCVRDQQWYPDHPERFDDYKQLLCRERLTGRCYWEVDWSGGAAIAVTYNGISRKGNRFGYNEMSWSLNCFNVRHTDEPNSRYSASHNNNSSAILDPPTSSNKVALYLDWEAGILSFYSVCSETHTLIHLHTFHATFTEPLYAGFRFWVFDASVCLC